MTDDGDAKEWVTTKVPKEQKDKARDYKPDDVTFGDCLVAGAERLNDNLDSDPPPVGNLEPFGGEVPKGLLEIADADAETLAEIREQLDRIESSAETAEQRTGNIERTLEDLQR